MRNIYLSLALVLCSTLSPAAQEQDPPSLTERGAQQYLEGLLQEMGPALDGMMDFIQQMGPAMRDILDEVQDWSVYEVPEMLPNGDIIIRRKPGQNPNSPEEQPQIDL